VAKSGGVYRSIDKSDGEKPDWMDITADLPVNLGISNLAVNPTNPDEAWVTFLGNEQDKKIFKGRPCRGNVFYWENVSGADVLPNVPVRAIIFADDDLGSVYIGMDCGVYYRNAELTEWISFNKGLRARMITDLLIQRDRGRDRDRDHYVIRAGTFSWGAWESPVYPVPEGR